MKEIKLIKGCGRTGNFIICLLNAIVYAIKNDYDEIDFSKIHWSPSPTINNTIMNSFFKQYRIPLSEAARSVKQVENDKTHVFEISTERFYRTVPLTFEERIKYIKKYISPIMKLTPQKIGVNDLVIHLRSGDIIVSGNSDMIQPPLEFYIKVIESRKWDKIYVITERKPLNPIFNALVDKYDVITFIDDKRGKQNGYNFKKDFDYLIGAKHYVPCQSSLCPFIIQVSTTIKHVYVPSYYFILLNASYNWWTKTLYKKKNTVKINDIQFNIYDYDKYIKAKKMMYMYKDNENKDLLINYKS